MMHIPGSLQEKSCLQSPVLGAGAAPGHSYSITEVGGPRLVGALGMCLGMGVQGGTGKEK